MPRAGRARPNGTRALHAMRNQLGLRLNCVGRGSPSGLRARGPVATTRRGGDAATERGNAQQPIEKAATTTACSRACRGCGWRKRRRRDRRRRRWGRRRRYVRRLCNLGRRRRGDLHRLLLDWSHTGPASEIAPCCSRPARGVPVTLRVLGLLGPFGLRHPRRRRIGDSDYRTAEQRQRDERPQTTLGQQILDSHDRGPLASITEFPTPSGLPP